MLAPVRPGETLAAASITGDTVFDSVVQLQNLPMTYAELGLWFVPFTVLPPWMKAMVIGTPQDFLDHGDIGGTTAPLDGGPIASQGHTTEGLQTRLRPWAGEVGGNQTVQQDVSAYAPFASWCTYMIAQDWYDTQGIDWEDEDQFQNEPVVSQYVRGATMSSFTVGSAALDTDPSSITSLAQLVEDLFLLTRTETTWAEYLAQHGVDPRRLQSMTVPLMLQHEYCGNMGSPQFFSNSMTDQAVDLENVEATGFANTHQIEAHLTDPDEWSTGWDSRGLGLIGTKWGRSGSPMIRFEQPGFIVGTHVWWGEDGGAQDYGHIFDATRLIKPGNWGHRAAGGIDEEDFITANDLYDTAGTSLQVGDSDQSGQNVMNMLNLFLHGEIAAPLGTSFFRYRGPYGRTLGDPLIRMSSRFSGQLHIISDLVAG